MTKSLTPSISYFARVDFRDDRRLFGIYQSDRLMGMYLLGKTGSGKTNMMKTLMYQDIMNGRGFCLFDINGDVLKQILKLIPLERQKDLIFLDAGDTETDWGYNPLRRVSSVHRPLVASNMIETFKKLWGGQSWGLKLEYILRNSILTLLEQEKASLDDVPRLLLDEEFRNTCISKALSKHIKRFWRFEFPKYGKADILPVLNKVGSFLAIPNLNRILTQNQRQLSLRTIMDGKKIFLVNLAKGQLGTDGAHLLGSLLLTSFSSAAFSRINLSESDRTPFVVYLDEFQNYTTGSLSEMFSEMRKFGLGFVLAHQYLHQISTDIRNAIHGNIGTIVCFTLGQADAKYMASEFSPVFASEDFNNLPHYSIYLKLLVKGITSDGFSAKTITVEDFQSDAGYIAGG